MHIAKDHNTAAKLLLAAAMIISLIFGKGIARKLLIKGNVADINTKAEPSVDIEEYLILLFLWRFNISRRNDFCVILF